MPNPKWKQLVSRWRSSGRHGLTVPYLCAATGMQPMDLVNSLYLHQVPIFRCGVIWAPVVGGGQSARGLGESVQGFLRRWFGLGVTHPVDYTDLAMYAHSLLSEGRVSVGPVGYYPLGTEEVDAKRYGPFREAERDFIYRVLGEFPPNITGVSPYGRIVYDYSG